MTPVPELLKLWLARAALILLGCAAWVAVVYVCSRKVVWFESDLQFLRWLLPGLS